MIKLFQALTADRKIIMEIREDDDRPLAHVIMDPEGARSVADNLMRLADMAEGVPPHA